MTGHFWFESASHQLLAHIDASAHHSDVGVVFVPPHGWEDICSYRPLRELAQTLAKQGFPALRYDLPATGDSEGTVNESGLVDAWILSVHDAAARLRAHTGVTRVVALGVRLGALLALAATSRHGGLDGLILWSGVASGKSLVRQLSAFRQLEHTEYATGDGPLIPITGLGNAGYLLAEETVAALNQLDLTALPPMQDVPVLNLSADDLAHDAKLMRALQDARCQITAEFGHGFAAMMSQPHDAQPPQQTADLIAAWLKQAFDHSVTGPSKPLIDSPSVRMTSGIAESCITVPTASGNNFGILTQPPDPSPEWAVLFLNAGGSRHIGPNRMWVEAARRWALNQGIPSLRVDLEGIGESDGAATMTVASLYEGRLASQVRDAVDQLHAKCGVENIMIVGLCSGAQWGFEAATHLREVKAAVLINPRLFFWDPEVDKRRIETKTLSTVGNLSTWKRLLKGELRAERIRYAASAMFDRLLRPQRITQIPVKPMRDAIQRLTRKQTRVTLIFTEGEPLLQEMEVEGHLPTGNNPTFNLIRVANTGHTFRPLWAQAMLHNLLDRELERVCASRVQQV